jgi:hypothetical protein
MTASTTAYRATARSRSGKEDNSRLTRSSEMSSLALLQSLKKSILSQANVKAIYGEPIAAMAKRSSRSQKSCMATERGRVLEVLALVVLRARAGAAVEEYGLFPWGS